MEMMVPRAPRDSLLRRLAIAKLRELRQAGMSHREIAEHFGVARAAAPAPDGFSYRLPPERLLGDGMPSAAGDHAVLLRALDTLAEGLAFFDCEGQLLHANRALATLLRRDVHNIRLRQEVQLFANSLCDLVRLRELSDEDGVHAEMEARDLTLGATRHRLKGSYLGLDLFGTGSTVLVALERPMPEPLSAESLRQRFGLSLRQSAVARLLVEGRANAEIARMLHISPHTARHHVERVLQKLGVRSRAEVGAKILWG